MTCHHYHLLQCHHFPWLYHFVASYTTSTHDGFSGVSTRISHWPTFSLVSLHFLVLRNQSDKWLDIESLCDHSIYYDITGTFASESTMPHDVPAHRHPLIFSFIFFPFLSPLSSHLHSLNSASLNATSPGIESDNTRQLRSTGKY